MISPGWGGQVDNFRVRVMTRKKSPSDAQGASSGDRLTDGDLANNIKKTIFLKDYKHTAPSFNGWLSAPYAKRAAFFVNAARPVIGKYSLSGTEARTISSAF